LFFPVLGPSGEFAASPAITRSGLTGQSPTQGDGQGKTKASRRPLVRPPCCTGCGARLTSEDAATVPPAAKPARGEWLIDDRRPTCLWRSSTPPRVASRCGPDCGQWGARRWMPAHPSRRLTPANPWRPSKA